MMNINLMNENGSAIVVVMAILFMMTIVGLSMFSISDDDVSITANNQNSTLAFYSAESGLALARSTLWNDYINWGSTNPQKMGGEIGNRDSYIKYLEQIGLNDSTQLTIASNLDLGDGQHLDSVSVTRVDESGATLLTVTSSGSSTDNSRHTIKSVLRVEGAPFKGFEFAILSNNINCIMCHATIDNVERVYNFDTAKVGTYDRVKVAALESMLLRTGNAESYLAGTLYTRGNVTDRNGNIITNLSPSGKGLEGFAISGVDGTIKEPLTQVSLTNTTGAPLPQFGNLYIDYPTDEEDMTDGALPTSFPPPFPDDNGNKIVDDAEFDNVASDATGTLTGGIIYGLMSNQTYSSGTLPGAGNETSVVQRYDGNLILVGTDANPLILNGNIAVNGDVIIQGKVKGTGQITARGNVYVTGDMTYADGDVSGKRTYGIASDGSRNALSVAAGKNILIGDYLTPKDGDINDVTNIDPGNLFSGEEFSFTMSEITLFNRGEWTKTQQFLPDEDGAMVPNVTYDPTYQPRYYVMNDGDPVYIYNKSKTYWDPISNSWQGSEHVSSYDMQTLSKLDAGDPQLTGATIVPLSSTSDWISPQTLKSLWIADEANRNVGDEFKIDGQLYTNNSIFTLTRSVSKTGGKMTVNGALVAADVGVLVGNGLNLNYDQRLKAFMKIKDESQVVISQVAWYSE